MYGKQGTALLFRRRRRPWPPPVLRLRPPSLAAVASLASMCSVVRCCLVSLGEGESRGREDARTDGVGLWCLRRIRGLQNGIAPRKLHAGCFMAVGV